MSTNDYLAAIEILEKRALKAEKELASGNEMIMNQCYACMARAEKAEAELEKVKGVTAQIQTWLNDGAVLSKQIDKPAIVGSTIQNLKIVWDKQDELLKGR